MKKIIRDTCILASIMILTVFAISILWSGITGEILLVFELFGLSFLLTVVIHAFDSMVSLPILYSYLVKYLLVTCVVLVFGFIVGWFYRSNFWMVFLYVAIVFVVAYFLDMLVTQRDVEYINERLKERERKDSTPVDKSDRSVV